MMSQDPGFQVSNGQDELLILSSSTGRDFMQLFVETLSDCFEADLATIGELIVQEQERINVLAGTFDGKPLDGFEYEACVTPCLDVIKSSKPQFFLSDVQTTYPKDQMFIDEGFQSYLGFPLLNQFGEAVGLIQTAWRREIDQEEADNVSETIEIFIDRLSTEMATIHTMNVMSVLAEGHQDSDRRSMLRLLSGQLQKTLKLRVAFIAESLKEDTEHFRILTYSRDGQNLHDVEDQLYAYAETPCGQLMEQEQFLIALDLEKSYPKLDYLASQGLTACFGINIRDHNGQLLGHLILQNDREIKQDFLKADFFKILSNRIGSELRQYSSDSEKDLLGGSEPQAIIKEIGQKLAGLQSLARDISSKENIHSLSTHIQEAQVLLAMLQNKT